MENTTDIAQTIIDTINTIFENLFASIDNNLYSVLDDVTFVSSDILHDRNFENIFGTSTSNGILLIANSLLFGFILYYAIRYWLAHVTYHRVENPFSFVMKMVLYRNLYEFFVFYFRIIFGFKL